jgi:hypothetical protein
MSINGNNGWCPQWLDGEEDGMAVGLIFVGTEVTQAQYEQVLAQACPGHQPPPGMLYHAAGFGPTGITVIDIFDSREHLDAFEHDQLRPAREAARITAHDVTIFPLINTMQPERSAGA